MATIVSFYELVIVPLGRFLWEFVGAWWWLLLPFLLFKLFVYHWLWWRADHYISQRRWTVLEVRIPDEVDNPFRRMEGVLAGMWQVKIGKNKREKWLEGKVQLGVSLEITSLEGKVHFYVRAENDDIELVKTSLYSQFPSVEITPVADYAKQVPADLPNKEWNMWGSTYRFIKDDPYPIKTYKQFFEEQATLSEDEPLRVDPLGQLLEGMSKLGQGEQMWIQIAISPVVGEEAGLAAQGRAIVDKIVRRPEKGKPKTTAQDVATVGQILATGKGPEEEKKEEEGILPPEMRITPGERDIVMGIEQKISKTMFKGFIRSLYIAKNDVFFGGMKATPMSYFNQFTTEHMNGIIVDTDAWTKVHTVSTWFLDRRRLYLRKRRQFRLYKDRLNQYWPRGGGTMFLNIEEVASLFHFPGRAVAPGAAVPRVEAKKGQAPPELPI